MHAKKLGKGCRMSMRKLHILTAPLLGLALVVGSGAALLGSATAEGRIAMGEKVIINIKSFMDGHRPPDMVLPSML